MGQTDTTKLYKLIYNTPPYIKLIYKQQDTLTVFVFYNLYSVIIVL